MRMPLQSPPVKRSSRGNPLEGWAVLVHQGNDAVLRLLQEENGSEEEGDEEATSE